MERQAADDEGGPGHSSRPFVHLVPARKPLRERGAVRDDDEHGLARPVEIQKKRRDGVSRRPVEITGGLVAEDERRVPYQRPRDRRTLLLSARQLGGTMIEPFGKADLCQKGARTRLFVACVSLRGRCDESRREHVLQHRALRQQRMVLEHEPDGPVPERRLLALREAIRILAFERHGSRGGRFESAENIEERALAAAGRPHDGNGIAAIEAERNVPEDLESAARRGERLRQRRRVQHQLFMQALLTNVS